MVWRDPYDSLKRLKSATNPESQTVSYNYDSNGNLSSRTDGRGITTSLSSDKLDRLIQKAYSAGAALTVALCYDGLAGASSFDGTVQVSCSGATALSASAYAEGKLTWEGNGNSASTFTQFDRL